ncbi:hypothetical protein BEWA_050660 [Theileria equi strain WA]|uniref:DNA (cytosine-5-)-methyltransferase n=1 Tax=Theileria equi strain WA TaxID=1537102 RepID=L1LBP3_THEEQ|nr:hypothetical protein BEWA_050660 [Theileria equi strain WA]EKX72598.1 hypothetical protein BEWA_050660 [Theileria equi strain WA]|eukprot:XP_004832050.1 hypothetical protein BEWA_050660 [Theileria equi strain WA]
MTGTLYNIAMETVRFLELFSGIGGMKYAFFYALRTHFNHLVPHTQDSTNFCHSCPSFRSFCDGDGFRSVDELSQSAEEDAGHKATHLHSMDELSFDYMSIDINNVTNEVLEYNIDSFGVEKKHKAISLDINALDLGFFNENGRFHVCAISPPCQPYSRRSPSELSLQGGGSLDVCGEFMDESTHSLGTRDDLKTSTTQGTAQENENSSSEPTAKCTEMGTAEGICERIKEIESAPNFDGRRAPILRITRLILSTDPEKLPLYIFLENIKEFYHSVDYRIFIAALRIRGYKVLSFKLSTLQFGFPNERTRLYITAKLDGFPEYLRHYGPLDLITELPNSFYERYGVRKEALVKAPILEFLNEENDAHDSIFNIPESILACRKSLSFDIVYKDPTYKGRSYTMCFTKNYGRFINGTGSVWCFGGPDPESYKDDNRLENLAVYSNSIRYFSPKEVARLMGFRVDEQKFAFVPFLTSLDCACTNGDKDGYTSLKFPRNLSNKQLYGLLGNSLNPQVVATLFLATGLFNVL